MNLEATHVPLIDSLPIDSRPEDWPTIFRPDLKRCTSNEGLSDWLRSPSLRLMNKYWTDRRGTDATPDRADIDPLDLPGMLGWIMLIERDTDPSDFRFRLVGSRIAELFGCDLTGRSVKALPDPDYAGFVENRFWEVVDRARPVASRYSLTIRGRQVLVERLDQPLTKGGDRVEVILTALVPLVRARVPETMRLAM